MWVEAAAAVVAVDTGDTRVTEGTRATVAPLGRPSARRRHHRFVSLIRFQIFRRCLEPLILGRTQVDLGATQKKEGVHEAHPFFCLTACCEKYGV